MGSVLSFHSVPLGDRTQVVRLDIKCLCLLSHLTGCEISVESIGSDWGNWQMNLVEGGAEGVMGDMLMGACREDS